MTDRIECGKFFWEAQLAKELVSFDFEFPAILLLFLET